MCVYVYVCVYVCDHRCVIIGVRHHVDGSEGKPKCACMCCRLYTCDAVDECREVCAVMWTGLRRSTSVRVCVLDYVNVGHTTYDDRSTTCSVCD